MSEFEFRGATIADLIGLPAVAIIKANQMMATEQVKLLMKVCFRKVGDDVFEPVTIAMSIRRGVIEPSNESESVSIRQVETTFQVPLITLIPINSLAIEDANIKFDMDVHTQQKVTQENDDILIDDDLSSPTQSYELLGNIKSDSQGGIEDTANQSRASSVSVNISTGQLPLPLGVSTILQAYSRSIYPLDVPLEQKSDGEQLLMD
ncbi:MAG: DUF2589 domain-containing protein [Okeania sp. SIO3H1]|uniref:DUF2589 domain-containing protein n=1 Tax=Okeania sp. SIO1I7 TaxID=2607772 RepID=UPI0013C5C388|nr:DUF2589 domain-containing protein [Okeania sp. SIO1I7]NEN88129.1 DUF2589 domain-containing protein [Okeania sp. SIO3H1]NET26114.1 DUF2589 domain-containing protein [Okeania sp. SIO1I7]